MHERIKREQEEEMKNMEAHIKSEFAKNEKDPNYEIDLLGDNNEFHKKVLKEEEKNKKIASNYYQKAKRYAKNKKYAKALKFYEKASDMDLDLSLNQDEQSANFNNEISLLYYKLKKYTVAYSHQRDASELFLRFKRENFKYLSFDKKKSFIDKNRYNLQNLLPMAYAVQSKFPNRRQEIVSETFMLWIQMKGEIGNFESYLISLKNMLNRNQKVKKENRYVLAKIDELMEKKKRYSKLFIQKISLGVDEPFPQKDENRMQKLKEEINDLERKFNQNLSFVRSIDYQAIETLDLSDISELLQEDELYIDFAKSDGGYYAFTLNKENQLYFYYLKDIDRLINQFREKITKKMSISEVKRVGKQLYRAIFDSIDIDNYQNLIISPDGLMNLLPFEALYRDNNYLIEDKNIQYIASARNLYKFRTEINNFYGKSRGIVVLSYLDYNTQKNIKQQSSKIDNEQKKSLNNLISDRKLRRLKATKSEASMIKNIFGKDVYTYIEQNGTKDLLYSINSPQILHLSTHSFYGEDDNSSINSLLKAGLALSGYNAIFKDGNNQGIMTALEFSTLNLLNTELVFFASCQSGLGDIYTSEGVSGLNRGAKIAGAKRVISTLWSVADKESLKLSTNFYKYLEKTRSSLRLGSMYRDVFNYHHALKRAKLDMVQLHPYYWAGFVEYGADSINDMDFNKKSKERINKIYKNIFKNLMGV
jgi:CHAT domain-containing protein